MTVYTGNCSGGASSAEIWTFTPSPSDHSGNGEWRQDNLSFDQNGKHVSAIGANYLNGGIAFSALVDGDATDTNAYFFGGMCPFGDDQEKPQSSAHYSNLMVTLEPSQNGTKSLSYQLDVSSSRGPPIQEAGFTLTGLQPSYSNRSDGTQTQQQNFVLVGGHTSAAFINMSQVALFSLPQQGWTFLPVQQPDNSRTDLAIRKNVDQVEPRSGHSAVLTPDGQHVIIFGGWIGDIDSPADPQLAVLNVGEGYGGGGPWEWAVPETSGVSLPDGTGIYGHGAAMLPGGIMMIMGGYSIPATSSRRRRAIASANTKTLFFNVTSNTWISDYSPPAGTVSSVPAKAGPLATTSQKAGLGAGLGIGMAAVLTLMVFYIWYTRRLKKQRQLREKQLQELAMGAHRYNLEALSPGVDGRGGHTDAADYFDNPSASYFYPSSGPTNNNRGWRQANGHDAERTGLLVEIPSPTRGLRRSLSGRAGHQMSRYDERRVKGSGNIHPIDELDEEQEQEQATDQTPLTNHPEMTEAASHMKSSIFDNAPLLDPFVDSNRTTGSNYEQRTLVAHSAPASPDRGSDRNLGIGAALSRRSSPLSHGGRSSPDRSDRTGSNLSDRSLRSNLSSNSTHGSITRSVSMRSTAMINYANHANPFQNPEVSPTSSKAKGNSIDGWESPIDARTRSLTSVRSAGRPNTADERDSFATARTSFVQLQAEGEALLGGNPDRARPGTASTSNGSNGHTYPDTEASMSRAGTITAATSVTERPARPRRKSWLGSVRRALARSSTTAEPRTRSLVASTPQLERYTDDLQSPDFSTEDNRKSFPASSSPPRRAASDASFWRSRRGKQDWLDEEIDSDDPRAKWRRNSGDDFGAPEDLALAERERQRREWRARANLINLVDDLPTPRTPLQPRDLGDPNRPSTPADEDDWDVEAAVERRVVQVMFTVPKSKLRVVNADVDRSSLLSLPRENTDNNKGSSSSNGTPSRVQDLVGRFEQTASSPRASPRPSPSPSIRSLKVRAKGSFPTLAPEPSSPSLSAKGKSRLISEDITNGDR